MAGQRGLDSWRGLDSTFAPLDRTKEWEGEAPPTESYVVSTALPLRSTRPGGGGKSHAPRTKHTPTNQRRLDQSLDPEAARRDLHGPSIPERFQHSRTAPARPGSCLDCATASLDTTRSGRRRQTVQNRARPTKHSTPYRPTRRLDRRARRGPEWRDLPEEKQACPGGPAMRRGPTASVLPIAPAAPEEMSRLHSVPLDMTRGRAGEACPLNPASCRPEARRWRAEVETSPRTQHSRTVPAFPNGSGTPGELSRLRYRFTRHDQKRAGETDRTEQSTPHRTQPPSQTNASPSLRSPGSEREGRSNSHSKDAASTAETICHQPLQG